MAGNADPLCAVDGWNFVKAKLILMINEVKKLIEEHKENSSYAKKASAVYEKLGWKERAATFQAFHVADELFIQELNLLLQKMESKTASKDASGDTSMAQSA